MSGADLACAAIADSGPRLPRAARWLRQRPPMRACYHQTRLWCALRQQSLPASLTHSLPLESHVHRLPYARNRSLTRSMHRLPLAPVSTSIAGSRWPTRYPLAHLVSGAGVSAAVVLVTRPGSARHQPPQPGRLASGPRAASGERPPNPGGDPTSSHGFARTIPRKRPPARPPRGDAAMLLTHPPKHIPFSPTRFKYSYLLP